MKGFERVVLKVRNIRDCCYSVIAIHSMKFMAF